MSNVYDGSVCPSCGRVLLKGEGRRLSLTQEQLIAVLSHYISSKPRLNQPVWCEENSISYGIYQRVVRLKYKNEKDRARIIDAANAIGYDILSATGQIR